MGASHGFEGLTLSVVTKNFLRKDVFYRFYK